MSLQPPRSTLLPYTTLFRSLRAALQGEGLREERLPRVAAELAGRFALERHRSVRWSARLDQDSLRDLLATSYRGARARERSEEHTSELQSLAYLVCRLLLEK